MENPTIEEFIEKVNAKIDVLQKHQVSCWLCGTPTTNWGVIIPDGSADALGFGSRGDGKARLVFFPVCKCHDTEREDNQRAIKVRLTAKRMEMLN